MYISRRDFLKNSVFAASAYAVPSSLFCATASEFDRCKNDILYFAEHYMKIPTFDNGDHLLYDIQKKYLKNIAANSFFICKKCRQSGITTMNMIYAMWKLQFFDNQRIDMVFHKYGQCRQVMRKIIDMNLYDDSFDGMTRSANCEYMLKNGNVIRFMTYNEFVKTESIYGQNNVTILDELAFCDEQLAVPTVVANHRQLNNTVIAVSTPYTRDDFFATLHSYINENRKMTITIDDLPKAKHKDELKTALGEKWFKQEYMCEV